MRLSFQGDQGQQLRQLLSSNSIRRVAMCALSSVKGHRQHLAVNHDKGKVRGRSQHLLSIIHCWTYRRSLPLLDHLPPAVPHSAADPVQQEKTHPHSEICTLSPPPPPPPHTHTHTHAHHTVHMSKGILHIFEVAALRLHTCVCVRL